MEQENKKFEIGIPYISNQYLEDLQRTLDKLSNMVNILNSRYQEFCSDYNATVTVQGEQVVSCYEIIASRKPTLDYVHDDLLLLQDMITTIVEAYLEIATAVESLADHARAVNLVTDLRVQLEKQMPHLNEVIGELNSYTFLLYDLIEEERKNLIDVKKLHSDNQELEQTITQHYHFLMNKRRMLNQIIAKRNEFMTVAIDTLRKSVAAIKIADLEADVRRRNEMLNEYREKTVLENINDYVDLEGQYVHRYDEEGKVIEDDETLVQEETSRAASYLILGVAIVIIVGAIFWYAL